MSCAVPSPEFSQSPQQEFLPTIPDLAAKFRGRYITGNAPEAVIYDVLQGMTAEFFSIVFGTDSSIIVSLEENAKVDLKVLYERLHQSLKNFFEGDGERSFGRMILTEANRTKSEGRQQEIMREYEQVTKGEYGWPFISAHWPEFVREHKRYLKSYDFQIDEDADTIDLADFEESSDRKSYDSESRVFGSDPKKTATRKVKLLLSTLADTFFDEKGNDVTKRDESIMRLAKPVPYKTAFNYMMHSLANTNGIFDMFRTLEGMSRDTTVRRNSTVKRVLKRLKLLTGTFVDKTLNDLKMIFSFENAFNKQKPEFFRQVVRSDGRTYFKTADVETRADILTEKVVAKTKSSSYAIPTKTGFTVSAKIAGKNNIEFLNNIGFSISEKDYRKLKGKAKTDFDTATNAAKAQFKKLAAANTEVNDVNLKELDIDSRVRKIAEIIVDRSIGEDGDSTHLNLEGEPTASFVVPNFVSTLLADAQSSRSLDEFLRRNPFMNDLYRRDSIFMNEIMFKNGSPGRNIQIGVVEGREHFDGNNAPAYKMTEAERFLYEINNNLKGIFYTLLPADSKTEWALNVGQIFSAHQFFHGDRKEIIADFVDKMWGYLNNEILLAKDFENRKFVQAMNNIHGDRPVGGSLRFFKFLLPQATVDEIHTKVIDGVSTIESVYTKEQFATDITNTVTTKAQANIEYLRDWRIIEGNEESANVYGIVSDVVDNYLDGKKRLSNEEMTRLFAYREMNYLVANIEMHKLLFGDPAQYSDETKRIKSFLSGKEATHVDYLYTEDSTNARLNTLMNEGLAPTDPGYHTFKNHIDTLTVRDVFTISRSIDTIEKLLPKADSAKYRKNNEADSSTWAHISTFREFLIKAGARWTSQLEELYQHEMAWERYTREGEGTYYYSSEDLREADLDRLRKGPPANTTWEQIKPLHAGVQYKNGVAVMSLDKTSILPLTYRLSKGRGWEKVYNLMGAKGIGYLRVESAHKVGVQQDSIAPLYDEKGKINTAELSRINSERILYKDLGIQQESPSKQSNNSQTEGSQTRKQITADIYNDKVPIDFGGTKDDWEKLSAGQKIDQSDLHRKSERIRLAHEALESRRAQKLFDKLGIKEKDGQFEFTDKKAIADYIAREIDRKELPVNLKIAIQIDPETGDFANPLEVSNQYRQIRNILYSTIQKTLIRPKIAGRTRVNTSVTGFETIKREKVKGQDVYTSTELNFYQEGPNGESTACEIFVPYFMGNQLMNQLRHDVRFQDKNGIFQEEEALTWLIKELNSTEDGKRLLSGIGFRIPTQGPNSIDHFVIKGFLPSSYGSIVVFPSEITTKVGLDFDYDKTNMYLKNFRLNYLSGLPEMVKFNQVDSSKIEVLKDYYEKYYLDDYKKYKEQQRLKTTSESASELVDKLISIQENKKEEKDKNRQKTSAAIDLEEEYQDELDDEEKELPYVPDVQTFIQENKNKPFYEFAHLDALENEYIEAMEDLMRDKHKFKSLITPNSADRLKEVANDILELKNQPVRTGDKLNFGNLLDSLWMTRERHKFMVGKDGVAVAAVSSAANVISQMAGVHYDLSSKNQFRLPANVEGNRLSIGSIKNTSKDNISRINSMFIDGYVDIAKGAWIIDMGATSDVANIYLLLNAAGVDEWTAALFMAQPAIQEFLKLRAIQTSVSRINPRVKKENKPAIYKKVAKMMGSSVTVRKFIKDKNKPNFYQNDEMKEMAKAYYKEGRSSLSKADADQQMYILDDFIKIEELAWERFWLIKGYNYDTSRFTDPNTLRLKEMLFRKAKGLEHIKGFDEALSSSFIGGMRQQILRMNKAFSSLFRIQSGLAGEMLDDFAEEAFSTVGSNAEKFTRFMERAEASILNHSIQTRAVVAGRPLNSYLQGVLLSPLGVAAYINAMQKHSNARISKNALIQALIPTVDKRAGYPSSVLLSEGITDPKTVDTMAQIYRELLNDQTEIDLPDNPGRPRTVAQIMKNLTIAAILQHGVSYRRGSILPVIPNEEYIGYVQTALNRDEMLSEDYDPEFLYRMLWSDNTIVPTVSGQVYSGDIVKSAQEREKTDQPIRILRTRRSDGIGDRHPYVKVVTYKENSRGEAIIPDNIQLYRRVDILGKKGPEPALVHTVVMIDGQVFPIPGKDNEYETEANYIYVAINKWGDGGINLLEVPQSGTKSQLATNPYVFEPSDDTVLESIDKHFSGKKNFTEEHYSQPYDPSDGDVDDSMTDKPDCKKT